MTDDRWPSIKSPWSSVIGRRSSAVPSALKGYPETRASEIKRLKAPRAKDKRQAGNVEIDLIPIGRTMCRGHFGSWLSVLLILPSLVLCPFSPDRLWPVVHPPDTTLMWPRSFASLREASSDLSARIVSRETLTWASISNWIWSW